MKSLKIKLTKLLDDGYLFPFKDTILGRHKHVEDIEIRLTNGKINLADFASGHEYFGLHKNKDNWVFREWAPNATAIYLVGDFSAWQEKEEFALRKTDIQRGIWEAFIPLDKIQHKDLYKLHMYWDGGSGDRIPAYIRRVLQDESTKIFCAQVWAPEQSYKWEKQKFIPAKVPLIYETHIGMAEEKEGIGTYEEFRKNILPRIIDAGYNTIQLMAIMEHPYYGSFGYHVANFFAASSRFGTPEELKALIDEAHSHGIAVIMDLIHSHSAKNEVEGLSYFDGTRYQYFHGGNKGEHTAWDSRCFDYAKTEVLHFLLSNCRFWLDEYKIDGYRFDGITSMLYYDHGLGTAFIGYEHYFDISVDEDALTYLALANKVIHAVNPHAITIAEDVSGMPGLGAPVKDGGIGFDYRLALGLPDYWFKLVKTTPDDYWNIEVMYRELTNKRSDEKTISYVECHDQAIVGSKTMAFELMDANMYWNMEGHNQDLVIERGIALHKMIRLVTAATAGGGYLNFMGNEFGHPEWIDFPREGNSWSYKYAKRQWHLRDADYLKYHFLADFDRRMIKTIRDNNIIEYYPERCYIHNDDKILVFKRRNLVFAFNFNPTRSFSDYFVTVPKGEYSFVMDSDDSKFGGQGRIAEDQHFKAISENENIGIKLYLPCRTAMILKAMNRPKTT